MLRPNSLRLGARGILSCLLTDLLRRTLTAATSHRLGTSAATSPPRGLGGSRLLALPRGFGINDSDALPRGEGSCELAGADAIGGAGGEPSGGGPSEATRELAGGGEPGGRRTGAGGMTMSACGDGGSPAFLCFTTGALTGILLERKEFLPGACDFALARGGIRDSSTNRGRSSTYRPPPPS